MKILIALLLGIACSHPARAAEELIEPIVIPCGKTYEQLSSDEKLGLRASYAALEEDDEPPYPVKGMCGLAGSVGAALALHDIVGTLHLVVQVNARGAVTGVEVSRPPTAAVERAVIAATMLQAFKPALCKGQPCAMAFPFVVQVDP